MSSIPGLITENLPGETQLAGKYLIGSGAARVGRAVIRKGFQVLGRWFRSRKAPKAGVHPGMRAARGGSPITRGKLDLGGGQAFRAGGTAFNLRTAAKAGAAALGVGGAVAIGKVARPTAAVHVAMGRSTTAPRVSFSSAPAPARASSPMPASSPSGRQQKRCGCPPGQRMLCFKRKHNPEAEAKRRARRKAAREKSKARTAKRTAKAKAAVARRKSARAARGVRRALRGKRAHRS